MRCPTCVRDWAARHPLLAACAVGAVLRGAAALTGWGYFASDDYWFVIRPAAAWLEDPEQPYPSPIRSELLPRIVYLLLRAARTLGADDPARALQFVYALLGLFSVAAIPAVYEMVRRAAGHRAAAWAAWLVAGHALMPRISTRTLIEVVAIVPLAWGVACTQRAALVERARTRAAVVGGLLCGVACMLRFQLGVAAVALLGVVVACTRPGERLRRAACFALGGAAAAALQGLLDVATGRPFLSTPWRYFVYNVEHSSAYGTTAWYAYLLLFVGLSLPPLTVWLARPLARAAKALPWAAVPLIAHVLVHSLVGHKEERFMFSVIPLFLALLAMAIVELREAGKAWVGRVYLGVNAVALLAVTLSDAQRAVTVPLLEVARGEVAVERVVGVGSTRLPAYYAGRDVTVVQVERREHLAARLLELGPMQTRFVFTEPPTGEMLQALHDEGYRCDPPRAYAGDWMDRLLVWLNPRGNRKRRPSTVLDCQAVLAVGFAVPAGDQRP